jgi:hypothetical protein
VGGGACVCCVSGVQVQHTCTYGVNDSSGVKACCAFNRHTIILEYSLSVKPFCRYLLIKFVF